MFALDGSLGYGNYFEILNFIYKNNLILIYPNILIAYQLFLTLPMAVASCDKVLVC
jgi:hypothetical protein